MFFKNKLQPPILTSYKDNYPLYLQHFALYVEAVERLASKPLPPGSGAMVRGFPSRSDRAKEKPPVLHNRSEAISDIERVRSVYAEKRKRAVFSHSGMARFAVSDGCVLPPAVVKREAAQQLRSVLAQIDSAEDKRLLATVKRDLSARKSVKRPRRGRGKSRSGPVRQPDPLTVGESDIPADLHPEDGPENTVKVVSVVEESLIPNHEFLPWFSRRAVLVSKLFTADRTHYRDLAAKSEWEKWLAENPRPCRYLTWDFDKDELVPSTFG
jgi:hypothetical protein